jgi:hypothetical protein
MGWEHLLGSCLRGCQLRGVAGLLLDACCAASTYRTRSEGGAAGQLSRWGRPGGCRVVLTWPAQVLISAGQLQPFASTLHDCFSSFPPSLSP